MALCGRATRGPAIRLALNCTRILPLVVLAPFVNTRPSSLPLSSPSPVRTADSKRRCPVSAPRAIGRQPSPINLRSSPSHRDSTSSSRQVGRSGRNAAPMEAGTWPQCSADGGGHRQRCRCQPDPTRSLPTRHHPSSRLFFCPDKMPAAPAQRRRTPSTHGACALFARTTAETQRDCPGALRSAPRRISFDSTSVILHLY